MILFPTLTIYVIVKKYFTINNKENTVNVILLIIFLYTQSHFIVFDFTMKSLPIIVFYFCWRMLQDSLTFELSSLSTLKRKKNENLDPRKKGRSAKRQSMTLLALKSSMYVLKIVKTKIVFPFIFPPVYFNFYVNFPFPSIAFQKQSFVANSKHIWHKLTKKLSKK